jgi:hypothetical protein
MTDVRPERGGARDFRGTVVPEYAPEHDAEPDPGEVVWAWVPYEEDRARGKDRPLVVVGRAQDDPDTYVGFLLSSREHDGDGRWHSVGAGGWDPQRRPSWVRIDRPLAVRADAVRREGAALGPEVFLGLVEHALGGAAARRGGPPASRLRRLVGIYRADGGARGEIAYVLGRLVGRAHCTLCDITHSPVRRKAAWDRMVATLPVPFELRHLNELDPAMAALVPDRESAPLVLADVDGRLEVLLGPADLEPLEGSVGAFEDALRAALVRRGLVATGR